MTTAKHFTEVCQQGYSVLGRTSADVPRQTPWQYGAGHPPSYAAFGRLRFLKTLELAKTLNPARVLEVAAGDGFLSACLVEKGREVLVNDLRADVINLSHWTTGPQMARLPGDLFALDPKVVGQFDLLLACDVIEHVANGDRFVAHLKRLLAPGGTLLLTTPNGGYFRSKLPTYGEIKNFNELESKQFRPDADGHLYLYTPEELASVLRREGFKNINVNLFGTPWISGHAGFRFLPKARRLTTVYAALETLFQRFPALCTQIAVLARE